MEGFSSPSNNGLLVFRVEGSVSFEELDLRLRLTPMGFVLMKNSKIGLGKEEDKRGKKKKKRKTREGGSSFSYYTLGNYSFPYKRSHSKVRNPFKIVDTCQ